MADSGNEVPRGISPPGADTRLLSEYLLTLPVGKFLDMGTGAGTVACDLAAAGWSGVAADINPRACAYVRKRVQKSAYSFEVIESDLFSNVVGTFDVIAFNPPYGAARSGKISAVLEMLKSLLPKENPVLSRIVFRFVRRQRARMIREFLRQAKRHIAPHGRIVMVVHAREAKDIGETFEATDRGRTGTLELIEISGAAL